MLFCLNDFCLNAFGSDAFLPKCFLPKCFLPKKFLGKKHPTFLPKFWCFLPKWFLPNYGFGRFLIYISSGFWARVTLSHVADEVGYIWRCNHRPKPLSRNTIFCCSEWYGVQVINFSFTMTTLATSLKYVH